MAINRSVPGIKNSVQTDINHSFDEDFGVLAAENLVFNSATGALDRMTQPGDATSAKQDDIIAELKKYGTNAIDDYTTTSVTYICKEKADTADWYIMKIDETGNFPVFTYATVLNNATKTTYALAYADRVTLTYGNFNTAF